MESTSDYIVFCYQLVSSFRLSLPLKGRLGVVFPGGMTSLCIVCCTHANEDVLNGG